MELPWRAAGPPNHMDDKVDSDQYDVDDAFSLYQVRELTDGGVVADPHCYDVRPPPRTDSISPPLDHTPPT